MYTIANLPAVQRDLFLARCVRRVEDTPRSVSTLQVEWQDMIVEFATDEAISETSVQVAEEIPIPTFTRRMESLLDCGVKSDGATEWVLKYSARISDYGTVEEARRLLCDKVASLDATTGETVGVLKIKRRSVNAGHAKIRIVPVEDSLQLVVRHTTAQGLKAVWKSVLWRLRPQYGSGKSGKKEDGSDATTTTVRPQAEQRGQATITVQPCIIVQGDSYCWNDFAREVSRLGGMVDIEDAKKKGICIYFPLETNNLMAFGRWKGSYWYDNDYCGQYIATVRLKRLPAGGLPDGLSMDNEGQISVYSKRYTEFREKAQKLSDWLGLGWNLPAVPSDTNENKPAS